MAPKDYPEYNLSDFTLAGWILIITFPVISAAGALVWGQVVLWMLGKEEVEISNAILAIPGLIYFGLYWGLCQWCGIRLTKPNRGYDTPNVPWRKIGIVVLCFFGPVLLIFVVLAINRLLNPIN